MGARTFHNIADILGPKTEFGPRNNPVLLLHDSFPVVLALNRFRSNIKLGGNHIEIKLTFKCAHIAYLSFYHAAGCIKENKIKTSF